MKKAEFTMDTADQVRVAPALRNMSLDLLRGMVMIVMALDHVRDFIHRGAMTGLPTDLETTTPMLFATRWITHICAPAFALAAGLSAWLILQRNNSRRDLAAFLLSRGVWLIFLELTVMRVAYYFSWSPDSPVMLLVLWSLGLSMVVLAAVIWLPVRLIGILALAGMLLHPLLDGINASDFGPAASLWNIVHEVGAFQLGGVTVITPYPLIPWVAVMALGFVLGPLFKHDDDRQRRIYFLLSIAALGLFAVFRWSNIYGDPIPWRAQESQVLTLMSFLNVSKYPASPSFLLMTLGIIFLLLGTLGRIGNSTNTAVAAVATFGKVPLFYYIVHFYIAHLIATLLAVLTYGAGASDFIFLPYPSFGGPAGSFPDKFGYALWAAYLCWLTLLTIIYPLCKWVAAEKMRRRYWWLKYV